MTGVRENEIRGQLKVTVVKAKDGGDLGWGGSSRAEGEVD